MCHLKSHRPATTQMPHGYLHGKVELKGGSKEDRLAAHEWISLFCHEALVV
jgi:hypothetical protein